jgi:hypothetical protein
MDVFQLRFLHQSGYPNYCTHENHNCDATYLGLSSYSISSHEDYSQSEVKTQGRQKSSIGIPACGHGSQSYYNLYNLVKMNTQQTQNKNWSILNWNVRGINDEAKQRAVRPKIEESTYTTFCIQETKMEFIIRILPSRSVLNHEICLCTLYRCLRWYSNELEWLL